MDRRWTYAALGAAASALLMLAVLQLWRSPPPAPASAPAAPAPAAPASAPSARSASEAPETSAPAHHLSIELEMAHRDLAAELGARINLEAEVSRLREELARYETPPQASPSTEVDARHRELDEAALIDAGLDAEQIDRLRERIDEFERARLAILDEETAENGLLSAKGSLDLYVLEGRLRNELDEHAYDAMLYATGRDNRLSVRVVAKGSPAQEAGIEPGDVLLRYGDQRLFGRPDLHRATHLGQLGEQTEIELRRDDERLRVFVPRGELGVHVAPGSEPPVVE